MPRTPHPPRAAPRRPSTTVFRSFNIGRLFGITIRIHALFVVMLVVVLFVKPDSAILLPILFGCVLLHELGHSLVAKRFGLQVLDITLWPLGGMARMSAIPEEPRTEALIAIAGPAVNFVLAVLALPLLLLPQPVLFFAQFFVLVNVLMGVFNLLPAFPMDGGRLLRAFLGQRNDWVTATERAVRVSRVLALLMLISWPFLEFNIVLPLIAAFVYFTGTQELMGVRMHHGYVPFGRYGDRSRPAGLVGSLFGFGNPASGFGGNFPGGFNARTATGTGDVRDAEHENVEPTSKAPSAGFSTQEIERLERFPGRLRQFRADEGA